MNLFIFWGLFGPALSYVLWRAVCFHSTNHLCLGYAVLIYDFSVICQILLLIVSCFAHSTIAPGFYTVVYVLCSYTACVQTTVFGLQFGNKSDTSAIGASLIIASHEWPDDIDSNSHLVSGQRCTNASVYSHHRVSESRVIAHYLVWCTVYHLHDGRYIAMTFFSSHLTLCINMEVRVKLRVWAQGQLSIQGLRGDFGRRGWGGIKD